MESKTIKAKKPIKNFKDLTYDIFEPYIDMCIKNPTEKQRKFFKDAFKEIASNKNSSKVTCFPARCGIGKSSFIQALMMACTHETDYQERIQPIGLIILTDSISRLEAYGEKRIDEDDNWIEKFYKQFSNKIIVLNSDEPFKKQLQEQSYKPILLMSTQRYFMLDDDIRDILFEFRYDDKKYSRNRIIFDERPYFSETIDLSIHNLNQINTALKMGLDNSVEHKKWIIDEFDKFSNYLQKIMIEKESIRNTSLQLFWKSPRKSITEDDEEFFAIIKENKDSIAAQYHNCYHDLLNFKMLLDDGGIFYSQKKQDSNKYDKGFVILKNNSDYFYINKKKVKIFVFDATCDIDPNYDLDYVEIIDCHKYEVPLNLKITNISTAATKLAICNKKATSKIEAIKKYLSSKEKLGFKHDMLIATYQNIIKKFSKSFKYCGYFGNLKGYNDFRNITKMAHIGFNRYTDLAYYLIHCSCHPKAYEILKEKTEAETIEFFDKLFKEKMISQKLTIVMCRSIIADFEQNIFRTAIRNYENSYPVEIWTFCNTSSSTYKSLFEMIEKRYIPLGVEFQEETEAIEIEIEKVKSRQSSSTAQYNTQKVIQWIESQTEGRKFKTADILSETGLNNKQFQKTKKCNPIMIFLENSKLEKKGFYEVHDFVP